MKEIYVLLVNGKIIGVSDDDMILARYVLNRRIKTFNIQKINKKKQIERILKVHSDKLIYDEGERFTTESDNSALEELIKEERYKLDTCLEILGEYINDGYKLKSDHREILKMAYLILNKKKKDNKFQKFINLEESEIDYNLIKSLNELKGEN